jgi:hypothetical protein
VLLKDMQVKDTFNLDIDVKDLPKGIYILRIPIAGKVYAKRFMKK